MSYVLMDQIKRGLSIEKSKVKVIASLGYQHFMCVLRISPYGKYSSENRKRKSGDY